MKYLLKLKITRHGAVCQEYYCGQNKFVPAPLTTLYPDDTRHAQMEAKRFNSQEEAKAAISTVVEEILAAALDNSALATDIADMYEEQIRSSAKIEEVPDRYVIRFPVHRNGANGFEYFQPNTEPFVRYPGSSPIKVSFVAELSKAKLFDSEEEAHAGISESVEAFKEEKRALGNTDEAGIVTSAESFRQLAQVMPI